MRSRMKGREARRKSTARTPRKAARARSILFLTTAQDEKSWAPKTRSSRVKERPENYPSDATQMREYCQYTAHRVAVFGLRVSRDIAWRWLETCGASASSLAKSEVSAESPPCSSDVSSRSCSEQPAGRFGALPAATTFLARRAVRRLS